MDWKTMREQAGLTLADLAAKSGYGISAINGLELKGRGSERLKERIREVLSAPKITQSVPSVDTLSVNPPVALGEQPRETRTIEQCRERIKELEAEVARLWRMIEASRPQGISYGRRPTEAQTIGARAGAADDLENPPPQK